MTVALATPLVWAGSAPAQFNLNGLSEGGKVVAHFDLSGPMTETPQNVPPLFGARPPASLKSMLARFQAAREDANVKAVVLEVESAQLGFGQIQEIRAAIRQFKAVDKPVFVHADMLTTGTYALATAASRVSITPTGDVWLTGLAGEAPYLKGMLDKMALLADFVHCGDYKTAAEPLTRTGPSPESEEMTNWLLDSLYDSLVKMIAESRDMTPDKVRQLIDEGPYSAEEARKAGLIDAVEHRQDFVAELKNRYGGSVTIDTHYGQQDELDLPSDPFGLLSKIMELLNPARKGGGKQSVAVVYVEGPIMTGAAEPSPFGPAEGAYSTTIRKALDEAAADHSVKAVVLRVDSPGGSALASEIILDASRRVADTKPLIVSMGNVAGSGGYYVTCAAGTIFADDTTITGSIGVVGGKLVTTGGWNKLGINWSSHSRGKNAMMLSSAAPFSESERERLMGYMNEIYDVFKGHVVKSRGQKLTREIDKLAGGRVYTGRQALELGLVDKMGGFDDAVKFAANKAGLGDYDVRVIPEPPNIFQLMFGGGQEDEYTRIGSQPSLFGAGSPLLESVLPLIRSLDPARADAVMATLKRLDILNREGVLMMTPWELVIE